MGSDRESEYLNWVDEDENLDSRLVFFAVLLFAALLGIFAAISFSFDDFRSATVLAAVGLCTFLGLTAQMIAGLNILIRVFYGVCGSTVFLFVVCRGGVDGSGLYGALGLVPGLVVVLGWRLGMAFLSVIVSAVVWVFQQDAYLSWGGALTIAVELKFFVTLAGLAVFCLVYGYTSESRLANLRLSAETMAILAFKDSMTDLPNRRSTENMLAQRWEEFKRSGTPFSVCLCNIDDFKELTGQFGRGFGDGVILRVANVLEAGLRSQDIIARWGEDEFFLIMPGESCQNAMRVAERVRTRVESVDLVMNGKPIKITMSIGVASAESALGPGDLVTLVEAGLYQAKHMGKNRVMPG